MLDANNNSIPDSFENRPPISELLNDVSIYTDGTYKTYCDATDDRAYGVFVPAQRNVVLLEVRGGLGGLSVGACLFRSKQELQAFLDELKQASISAFGML